MSVVDVEHLPEYWMPSEPTGLVIVATVSLQELGRRFGFELYLEGEPGFESSRYAPVRIGSWGVFLVEYLEAPGWLYVYAKRGLPSYESLAQDLCGALDISQESLVSVGSD